jgi:hypothetical protein
VIDRFIFWLIEKEVELIVNLLLLMVKHPVKSAICLAALGLLVYYNI